VRPKSTQNTLSPRSRGRATPWTGQGGGRFLGAGRGGGGDDRGGMAKGPAGLFTGRPGATGDIEAFGAVGVEDLVRPPPAPGLQLLELREHGRGQGGVAVEAVGLPRRRVATRRNSSEASAGFSSGVGPGRSSQPVDRHAQAAARSSAPAQPLQPPCLFGGAPVIERRDFIAPDSSHLVGGPNPRHDHRHSRR
jgi:hypothetical protein